MFSVKNVYIIYCVCEDNQNAIAARHTAFVFLKLTNKLSEKSVKSKPVVHFLLVYNFINTVNFWIQLEMQIKFIGYMLLDLINPCVIHNKCKYVTS